MALQTRENPTDGRLEVLIAGEWVLFEQYRKQQIDEAYQTSVNFLRDRLGEDNANKAEESINEATQ